MAFAVEFHALCPWSQHCVQIPGGHASCRQISWEAWPYAGCSVVAAREGRKGQLWAESEERGNFPPPETLHCRHSSLEQPKVSV